MNFRRHLLAGQVIPEHPLALTPQRTLDERHQRALTRYFIAAGAGGMVVGGRGTGLDLLRDPRTGLLRPVLELAAETAADALLSPDSNRPFVRVAGLVGETRQAVAEGEVAEALGYHAGLLHLHAMGDADDAALVRHVRAVADVLPLVVLQEQLDGERPRGYRAWRELAELANVVAIVLGDAPRAATLDVVRAIAESGREDVALYAGSDATAVIDLLTPFPGVQGGRAVTRRVVGGVLAGWGVHTRGAVALHAELVRAAGDATVGAALLARAAAHADLAGALAGTRHPEAGPHVGLHELLRRQGLMRGVWTLDPRERLTPEHSAELDRVQRDHPGIGAMDDEWIAEHREEWLR